MAALPEGTAGDVSYIGVSILAKKRLLTTWGYPLSRLDRAAPQNTRRNLALLCVYLFPDERSAWEPY